MVTIIISLLINLLTLGNTGSATQGSQTTTTSTSNDQQITSFGGAAGWVEDSK
jgi:hypothetical protein